MEKDKLNKIINQHKLWVTSDGIKGNRADLEGADLQDTDLQGVDLQKAKLKGSNLKRSNLKGANLQSADLRKANLQNADLQEANLRGADFRESTLQRAYLYGTNLEDAYLQSANLQGTHLRNAFLQGSNLQNADLQEANLQGTNLRTATMNNTDLRGANLKEAEFIWDELKLAKLWGTPNQINTKRGYPEQSRPHDNNHILYSYKNEGNAELKLVQERLNIATNELKKIRNSEKKLTNQQQKSYIEQQEYVVELEKQKQLMEEQIISLQNAVDERVDQAIDAMQGSITETDTDIETYRKTSKSLFNLSAFLYLCALGCVVYSFLNIPENFNLADIWIRGLPIILLFSMGTALLRHDAKIRLRYEHLSDKKHLLEKTTGLLSASKSLSEVPNAEEKYPLLLNTFKTITNKLLGGSDTSNSNSDDSNNNLEDSAVKSAMQNLIRNAMK